MSRFVRQLRRLAARSISILAVVSFVAMTPFAGSTVSAEALYPYNQYFTISAYYSPLPDQEKYATGSYEGDIRLNGSGVLSADNTPVFPGMIAAPKNYPFGTKLSIPGIGIASVHDRGGAIVNSGERGNSYDRLDVWMGYGDAGLKRALNWGKRVVDVTVYGVDPSLETQVYLEGFSMAEAFVKNVILAPQLFDKDLWYLTDGEDVERLQGRLKDLGYFDGEITGFYGDETKDAVFQFQLDEGVVESKSDLGAGHTGVNTRKMLDLAVARLKEDKEKARLQRFQKGVLLLEKHPDLNRKSPSFYRSLSLGSMGDDVRALQEELNQLGFLRMEVTGYFGSVTEHAVFKLQQKLGILVSLDDYGAGVFGPTTRSHMSSIFQKRLENLSFIALAREERTTNDTILVENSGPFGREFAFGDRGEEVKILQQLLKRLGFFKGFFITEFYGDQTRKAVIEFQLANGLIESSDQENAGLLDAPTRDYLNSLS